MCSILGYKGIFDGAIVSKLLYNSRIRGLHAFGYSFFQSGAIETRKFLDYNVFVKDLLQEKPDTFIAHFRYSTSGDYKELENNQPLFQNNTAIAFNGVISQRPKFEMEFEYKINLLADNDGYILLHKHEDTEFINKRNISFAMVGLKDKKIFALRNRNRPLHIYTGNDLVIVASTKDILTRSGLKDSAEMKPLIKYEL
jgi:glutamine phosphoribosylpyrophosphate amidotransferase